MTHKLPFFPLRVIQVCSCDRADMRNFSIFAFFSNNNSCSDKTIILISEQRPCAKLNKLLQVRLFYHDRLFRVLYVKASVFDWISVLKFRVHRAGRQHNMPSPHTHPAHPLIKAWRMPSEPREGFRAGFPDSPSALW